MVKRIAGFLLIPALGALAPLMVLPALTSNFGAETWGWVALGQSLGLAGAIAIELGWGLTGPQEVTRTSIAERKRLYRLANYTKLVAAAPTLTVLTSAAALIPESGHGVVTATALAFALSGFSPAWMFLGTAQPRWILLSDTLPRLGAAAATIIVFESGGPVWAYPAAVGTAGLISPIVGYLPGAVGRDGPARIQLWEVRQRLRIQRAAVMGRIASSVYLALPVSLVAVASPGTVPQFAAIERVMRLALTFIQAVPNAFQEYIGSRQAKTDVFKAVAIVNLGAGLVAAAGFAIAGPYVLSLLFAQTIEFNSADTSLAGLVIFLTCASRLVGGLFLVRLGRARAVAWSAAAGLLVGLIAIPAGALLAGTSGAILGEVVAEATVLLIQVGAMRSTMRDRRDGEK